MINIKNIGTATVTVLANEYKFRRKIVPGRSVPVPEEVYDALTYDPGFLTFVRSGFLRVENVNKESQEVIESEFAVASADEIKAMFNNKDITKFSKLIPNASPATKDTIVKLAIDMRAVDNVFVALIKKYCGVDIIQAIAAQEGV